MAFTGYAGKATRTIVASFRTLSPLSFLWYTVYESEDSSITGTNANCNRFYYQVCIPIKDANILANCPDREVRRRWIQRIIDHDGTQGDEGGIEAWIRLGMATGLAREEVTSLERVLPGVRLSDTRPSDCGASHRRSTC